MNIPKKELSNDPVFHRILTLLKEQNKTQKSLIDYLNIHPNTLNKWKYGTARGYITRINEIADYLNVTPGYLLKGNINDVDIEGFTPRETEILHRIRKLYEEQQIAVNNLLKTMI
jgi:transcriptional regulator with XRE-family HTH domain